MSYDGFQVHCHCHCSRCNNEVVLEGYSDAWGNHYCPYCDDYVPTLEYLCKGRTTMKVAKREKIIMEAGADKD